ncbi:hypothetical protein H6P81_001913 [Aristolochia fimbriata]|uniref:Uncharacterized protein n=1 Tax=Aristolochia fimbriata TaxID=158543 RepID=A0AAV7FB12_ARIFI|nr:hypothetical protein H6P81_001913 [Aristolochia fimbriata]
MLKGSLAVLVGGPRHDGGRDGGIGGERERGGGGDGGVFEEEGVDYFDGGADDVVFPGLHGVPAALEEDVGGVEPADVPAGESSEAEDLVALSVGEVDGIGLDVVDGLPQESVPVGGPEQGLLPEVPVHLPDPNGAADADPVVGSRVKHGPDLPYQSFLDHLVDPVGDEGVEDGEGDVNPEEAAVVPRPEAPVRVVHQRLNVGVGPPGDDGELPLSEHRVDGAGCLPTEVGSGEVRLGVDDAEEVVADEAALLLRHLVGDDVEALVDLHFVGVDDLGGEKGGQVDGELRFPGPRRPDHEHHLLFFFPAVLAPEPELTQRVLHVHPHQGLSLLQPPHHR